MTHFTTVCPVDAANVECYVRGNCTGPTANEQLVTVDACCFLLEGSSFFFPLAGICGSCLQGNGGGVDPWGWGGGGGGGGGDPRGLRGGGGGGGVNPGGLEGGGGGGVDPGGFGRS